MKRPFRYSGIAGLIIWSTMAISSAAQGPGNPPPGGGMGGPGFPGQRPPQRGPGGDNRGGLELGPPGRWWDDRQFGASLKLRPEQRTRMDAIFEQSRGALQARLDAVHQAEAQMHDLANAPSPDEAALFTQIDRISQARADLEKATTHMLLLIRKEMDPNQIKLLEAQMDR